ncbi:MAG TPA: hypothetical protein VEA38_11165 [Terriglobales bacterium]|nr:hypothetical protein [Terriglobales bacterium]
MPGPRSKIAVPQDAGDEMQTLTLRLPASFVIQLRVRAAQHRRSISDDVMDAYACHPTEPLEAKTYWRDDRVPPKRRRR